MNGWRLVRFEPLDVLVNADARGMATGGFGHDGPISPAAFAGALRTLVLRNAGYAFEPRTSAQTTAASDAAAAVGLGDPPTFPFRFAGPFMQSVRSGEPLFPAPMHVPVRADGGAGDGTLARQALVPVVTPLADSELTGGFRLALPEDNPPPHAPARGWVTPSVLARLLLEPADAADARSLAPDRRMLATHDLVGAERRHGHQRDRGGRGVVEEGLLFSRGALRFRPRVNRQGADSSAFTGLVAGVDGHLADGAHLLRLAGDGHLAATEVVDAATTKQRLQAIGDLKTKVAAALATYRGALLYLATPAVFDDGWRPSTALTAPLGLELVAAAVDRPVTIAGWDMHRNGGQPKPVRQGVAAGAVYYYRLQDGCDIASFLDRFMLNASISDAYAAVGFGLTVVGAWDARATAPVTDSRLDTARGSA